MATIEIKDVKGAAAGTVELSDAVFAIEPNVPVMHRTVKAQQASWRQGTANTRTRGMVRGGVEKPCTKDAVALIKALGLEGKRICVVIGNEDIEAFLSFRNIPEVNILPVGDINTYELVDNKALVIAEPCLARIEEVLA